MTGPAAPQTWNPFRPLAAWLRGRQEALRRDVLAAVQRRGPDASRGDVWYEASRSRRNLPLTLVILVLDRLEAEGLVSSVPVLSLARAGETRRAYAITPLGAAHLAGRAP